MKKTNLINELHAHAKKVAHDYKHGYIMTDEPIRQLIEQLNTCPYFNEVEEEIIRAYGFESVEEYNEQLFDGIDPQYMTKTEVEWLNNYHAQVFEKISPYLTEEETEWLKEYTRAI